MRVHVTLRGTLAERLPGGSGEVELDEGSSVAALAEVLGLPIRHCVVVVNGATSKRDTVLDEGDRVQVFPPMAGGFASAAGRVTP